MWPKNHSAKIAALEGRVAALEVELEREKSARLTDKLETLKKFEELASGVGMAVSSLRPKRDAAAPMAFRNSRDFVAAVEREEKVNA